MEIYVMPAFNKLKVKDISRVSRWYQSRLGFVSLFQYKNGVDEVIMEHIRGGRYQDIMLIQSDKFEVGNGVIMNFTVADIEEIVKRCREDEIVEPIRVQPWNATELTIRDSEGYLITLTQTEGKILESFDSVIDNVHAEYD